MANPGQRAQPRLDFKAMLKRAGLELPPEDLKILEAALPWVEEELAALHALDLQNEDPATAIQPGAGGA